MGSTGQAGQANYAASKAGLVGLARSLAREFASRNITVNVVAPGPDRHRHDRRAERRPPGGHHRRRAPRPLRRPPEEVAATVQFLATDAAGYITGAVVPVDGGLGMGAIVSAARVAAAEHYRRGRTVRPTAESSTPTVEPTARNGDTRSE